MNDPAGSTEQHHYVSTACVHGRHAGCRVVCKFCSEICLCDCHWDRTPNEHTTYIQRIEMGRRSSP